MSTNQIVAELDAEIARLKSVVAVLSGGKVGRAAGRTAVRRSGLRRRRVVSAATRALIAEKMRLAWARGRKKHK
jgi:hypothetical protein